ncbi:TonB C-terminal domain-containing protein [Steroidobacter flavus]|uniref:TonB C-terminal domain-containing protein n=1 Tax=Steroidobacter flavus TaxID=1842136 RepID=A0ABV8SK63_9GAMM
MNKHRWQRYVPLAAGTVIVLVVGVVLIKFVMRMMAEKPDGPQRQVAQVVKIVRPPEDQPPPPPPPPPEEKIEEPIEQQEPEQAPQDAAPAGSLGVDAEGSAGGDGFGLAARKGGREFIPGSGTAPFRWYTDLVAKSLEGCISEDEAVRRSSYKVDVKVQVDKDGSMRVVDLVGSSGNAAIDAAIRGRTGCNIGQSRPVEVPALATIRVISR